MLSDKMLRAAMQGVQSAFVIHRDRESLLAAAPEGDRRHTLGWRGLRRRASVPLSFASIGQGNLTLYAEIPVKAAPITRLWMSAVPS